MTPFWLRVPRRHVRRRPCEVSICVTLAFDGHSALERQSLGGIGYGQVMGVKLMIYSLYYTLQAEVGNAFQQDRYLCS